MSGHYSEREEGKIEGAEEAAQVIYTERGEWAKYKQEEKMREREVATLYMGSPPSSNVDSSSFDAACSPSS
jgi:hypothetical protein